MAIVIEEERQKGASGGVIAILVWLVILGIIAAAVYFIFFAEPEFIQISTPEAFTDTERVAQADIDPQTILSDSRFSGLQQYVTLPPPGSFGRSNPFLGFDFAPPKLPAGRR